MPAISRKKRVFLLLAGLALFLAIANGAHRTLSAQKKLSEETPIYSRGMTLPASHSLESMAGKTTGLSDFEGKVVLINFWAGWCGPCLTEMPGLYSLHSRLQGRGLEVLAVNMDENPQEGLKTLRNKVGDAPFPVLKGAGSSFASQFAIGGLPYSVVIDRNRKILYARSGEIDWKKSDAVTLIEETL